MSNEITPSDLKSLTIPELLAAMEKRKVLADKIKLMTEELQTLDAIIKPQETMLQQVVQMMGMSISSPSNTVAPSTLIDTDAPSRIKPKDQSVLHNNIDDDDESINTDEDAEMDDESDLDEDVDEDNRGLADGLKKSIPPKPLNDDTRFTTVVIDLPNIVKSCVFESENYQNWRLKRGGRVAFVQDCSISPIGMSPSKIANFQPELLQKLLTTYIFNIYPHIDHIYLYTSPKYDHINMYFARLIELYPDTYGKISIESVNKSRYDACEDHVYHNMDMDQEIINRLINLASNMSRTTHARLFLFSGDGDFVDFVEPFKALGIKIHIIANRFALAYGYVKMGSEWNRKYKDNRAKLPANGEMDLMWHFFITEMFKAVDVKF